MFKFTVEVGGRDVAVITAVDRVMLDGFVGGHIDDGAAFRADLKRNGLWNGKSPITYRLATEEESDEFDCEFQRAMSVGNLRPADKEWFVHWLVPLLCSKRVAVLFPLKT
jgi:hypothetical protein